jgi:signal transduction histidine kinase
MAAMRGQHEKDEASRVDTGELLAMVAHDLRSPLATIVMSADLLYDGAISDDKRRHVLDIVHHSASQMERLIDDLLGIAKVEAGRLQIDVQTVSARPLVIEACASFESQAAAAGIALTWSIGPDLPQVYADRDRIDEVLANLLSNALKFTPAGGRVEVHAERENGDVVFSVSDTGCGIPADQLEHVFDRFWQARHVKRAGAGLGLAIARGIVDAHRGRMWVSSTPGEGSTFFFLLPAERRLSAVSVTAA